MSRIACAAALMLVVAVGIAAEPPKCSPLQKAKPEVARVRALVCAGDIDGVERYLDRNQREYEAGRIDDDTLLTAYGAFSQPFESNLLDAWLKRYPSSYSAHIASAFHHVDRGADARGGRFRHETSEAQFEAMRVEFERAKTHLDRSLSLTRKPYATYYCLLLIGKHAAPTSERRGALVPRPDLRQLLDKAIQLDARAYRARFAYMDSLQLRWGGNVEAMAQFYDESVKAGCKKCELGLFRARMLHDRASLMDVNVKAEERLRLEVEANTLHESTIYLSQIVWLKGMLGRHADALPDMNRAIELDPGDLWMRERRANALFALGRMGEAYPDYLLVAQDGDGFAQNKVGYLLYWGIGVREDKRQAVAWFWKSAMNRNRDGMVNFVKTNLERPFW